MAVTLSTKLLRRTTIALGALDGVVVARIALFTNDVTPTAATVIADLTLLSATNINFLIPSSTLPFTSGGWEVLDAVYSVDVAGARTVYGWCVYSSASVTNLYHAHRFSSPIDIPASTNKNISVEFNLKTRQN